VSTQPKLLDRVRDRLRYKQYSPRTEQAYIHWIKRFIFFHGKRHPEQMNGPEVEAFLTHLAKTERVAAATQDQAMSALLFLYKEILQKELPWLDGVERSKRPARLPVVLTESEVRALLARLEGNRLELRIYLQKAAGVCPFFWCLSVLPAAISSPNTVCSALGAVCDTLFVYSVC